MAVVEISVVPIGVSGTSLSAYVAEVLKVLGKTGLSYELTAMGTIITGDLDEIWKVMKQMHEACFSKDVVRVLTQIKIDDRRDQAGSANQKVQSVLEKL